MVNTTKPPPTAPRSRLDGDGLLGMFLSALHLLERNVDKINALNVFPVPDGDTGTNMYLTLRSVVEESRPLQGASSAAVSRKMADVALMASTLLCTPPERPIWVGVGLHRMSRPDTVLGPPCPARWLILGSWRTVTS